jgi:hypothetical protein
VGPEYTRRGLHQDGSQWILEAKRTCTPVGNPCRWPGRRPTPPGPPVRWWEGILPGHCWWQNIHPPAAEAAKRRHQLVLTRCDGHAARLIQGDEPVRLFRNSLHVRWVIIIEKNMDLHGRRQGKRRAKTSVYDSPAGQNSNMSASMACCPPSGRSSVCCRTRDRSSRAARVGSLYTLNRSFDPWTAYVARH